MISFTSKDMAPMHSCIHYPPSTDVEAYTGAIPLKPFTAQTITTYSTACWGSQIGSAVAEGPLQVSKYEWWHHFQEWQSSWLAW
jgi:hypothetical protein